MFNVIFVMNKITYIQRNGITKKLNEKIVEYLNRICLSNGSTFKGHIQASKELLPKYRKVPIYIAEYKDYLIPLSSVYNDDYIWISANNFLTCYERKGKCYIKFKDRSIHEVNCSAFTIRMQYEKYCKLDQKRKEMKDTYIVNDKE